MSIIRENWVTKIIRGHLTQCFHNSFITTWIPAYMETNQGTFDLIRGENVMQQTIYAFFFDTIKTQIKTY